MKHQNIFRRLRCVANCALFGGVALSVFFGWIDRSVDLHPIGAIIGATAASLKLFHTA
ncbi:hypothetical protein [Paraburkholderia humisilvae]|uniref:Uncharacterized protein n=1 Tax=Paraburkholderia humisilvae TaxID=627669 RepID=A0A6J5E0N5_9BURK|nr:hypothetical protein [Paraburkholderia humisilvae]CAB3758816.1 hypothetical protein LMG29542_03438 [Paraburkholderia humisilvae]